MIQFMEPPLRCSRSLAHATTFRAPRRAAESGNSADDELSTPARRGAARPTTGRHARPRTCTGERALAATAVGPASLGSSPGPGWPATQRDREEYKTLTVPQCTLGKNKRAAAYAHTRALALITPRRLIPPPDVSPGNCLPVESHRRSALVR
ncbi:hypothetical protein PUN28_010677 [Cardiocondyla obscurior]|uniref:Uncharacterized protein n=1 Tax=Cardiocondyla obscurior TaxID=286306 RepID=A0AAW2FKG5_9HYME